MIPYPVLAVVCMNGTSTFVFIFVRNFFIGDFLFHSRHKKEVANKVPKEISKTQRKKKSLE